LAAFFSLWITHCSWWLLRNYSGATRGRMDGADTVALPYVGCCNWAQPRGPAMAGCRSCCLGVERLFRRSSIRGGCVARSRSSFLVDDSHVFLFNVLFFYCARLSLLVLSSASGRYGRAP
jgi:hypothetical protein